MQEESLKCPLSLHIFRHPVIASDGHTYEYELIKKITNTTKVSPITKEVLTTTLTYNRFVKNLVEDYLIQNPDKKSDQYNDYIHILNNNLNIDTLRYDCLNTWRNNIVSKLHFEYYLNKYFFENYEKIFKLPIEKQKEYIDNMDNLECDNFGLRPIHIICQYGTLEMLQYIVNKGVDLECQTNNKTRPIHYICKFGTFEMLQYIVNKGVDLECQTKEKWRPIHYICKFGTFEMLQYIVNKGVDLECQTKEKWRPIHFICEHGTLEMLKYIVDKRVDLECENKDKKRPIHIICQYRTFDMIEYIMDRVNDINYYKIKIALNKRSNKLTKNELDNIINRVPLYVKPIFYIL